MEAYRQIDDIEAACILFALYDENEFKKRQSSKRRHWVHQLNLKRPENGQFQVTFMTLRSYPEEFLLNTIECRYHLLTNW